MVKNSILRPVGTRYRGYAVLNGSLGRWSIVVETFLIAGVASVAACAVMAAGPAHADEAAYLQQLLPNYPYLNPQQVVGEGYRVCQAERGGSGSANAVDMVYRDLAVSMTVANDVVRAAAVDLG